MTTEEIKKPIEELTKTLIYFCRDNVGKKKPDIAPLRAGFLTFHLALAAVVQEREQKIWESVRDKAFLNNDARTYIWAKTKLHKATIQ